MLGAIAGDIIGSVYEFNPVKQKEFPLFSDHSEFTDDTVMTIATAEALLHHRPYTESFRSWGRRYPGRGYGTHFQAWLNSDSLGPYNSFGNGSAMRVSPVAYSCNALPQLLLEAKKNAEGTHNHPEGIKGAQATAVAIFWARQNPAQDKEALRSYLETTFDYHLQRTCDSIREGYHFQVSCQQSVPESIIAFLDSTDFEDAIRNAVSLGGDADTMAAISGSIAEPYYGGVPQHIQKEVMARLPQEMITIVNNFYERLVQTNNNEK